MKPAAILALVMTVLALSSANPRSAEAQFYDPQDDPYYDDGFLDGGGPDGGGRTETFIDEFGRRVTVDSRGRIIAVEQPRRQRRDQRGVAIIEAPPADRGLVLEGRVGEVPGVDPGFGGGGPSADPFYDDPIRSDPLPAPGEGEAFPLDEPGLGGSRNAALPGYDGGTGEIMPDPAFRGGVRLNETTVPEADPAPSVAGPKGKNAKVEIAALQVLLDRAGISPGVIDGRLGSNVDKAVAAYEEKYGTRLDATNAQALAEELDATGGPAIASYTITERDIAGPYVAAIPDDYGEKAKLPAMSYVRTTEMLAERFHMDEAYLQEINPGADFSRPGTIIKVVSVGVNVAEPVTRIVADKGREQVRAYDAAGRLVVAYPSTIGSSDTPSPSGTVEVSRIAIDPNYTYNPKINFTQGENKSILTIPPGPNGPVGSVWIALSKPTYGIHGTPEPSKIGKTNSHGCVRLANFDAQELAKLVKPGVTVEFLE
ncbi:MAG: murein L,D-transpeptidase [Rhizobiaceae bacterium]|nr:murein L,D-transpeptidase [Rhizobiaceae bacterium]